MKIDSKRIFITIFLPVTTIGFISFGFTKIIPSFNNSWINIFYLGGFYALLFCIIVICFYLNKDDKKFLRGLIFKRKHDNGKNNYH